MGRLTTHVLDTASGKPGAGIRVSVIRIDGERRELGATVTNHGGRCDVPLLEGAALVPGIRAGVWRWRLLPHREAEEGR